MADQADKITIDDLKSICGTSFENSKLMTAIAQEREKSLKAYNSERYGNEVNGLSKFVTSDVRDVIEWTMPQLMDIFWSSDLPVVFLPEDAADVDQADIESRYCQNVLENQNLGYIQVYSWFKDALMQKNGIMKAWWEEKTVTEREEYKSKSNDDYMALSNDTEFDIDKVTVCLGDDSDYHEYSEKEFDELLNAFTDPQAKMQVETAALYNIVGFRKRDVSQVRIECIAPERFFINRTHNSPDPQSADYTAEVFEKTRSELIEEGYEKGFIDSLSHNYDGFEEYGSENVNRYKKEGGGDLGDQISTQNTLTDKLMIVDHYLRVDFDGDGIAELRRVRTNGPSGDILDNDPVDRNIFHSITPYINTHKFFGRSIADNLMDIQKLKTQVSRGVLDNLTYSISPRKIISGDVNISDLMQYIPGGVIRKGTNGTVDNETTPFVGDQGIATMQTVDQMRAERSGFSADSVGLNPQALSNSTTIVGTMIMSQSQSLTKMIASNFANTGFNSLMLHIRELLAKYETKQRIFEIAGNWVPVDPRAWRKNRSSTVKTGIGYAAKAEKMAVLQSFLDLQTQIATQTGSFDSPLTSSQGTFKLIDDMGKVSGVKDGMKYWRDPSTYQAPPKPPTLADYTFQLQKENLSNQQTASEAKKATDIQQFNQNLDWEKQKFQQSQDQDQSQFETEMLYKYGQAADDHAKEFFNALAEKDKNDREVTQQAIDEQKLKAGDDS